MDRIDWIRIYYAFSERFGWLPRQISKLTLEQVREYLKEIGRIDKLQAQKMPKMPRMPATHRMPRR